jgi:2'-5' RNA ligase
MLSSDGADRINSFALVTYIPDPLGRFLDDLRLEIVPRCNPHAHVSILPPRPVFTETEVALEQICARVEELPAFRVETAGIEIFPVTNVIYIAIGAGQQEFETLHAALCGGALEFDEPFVYHPHITLAQELAPENVPAALELAKRRWAEWPNKREFLVDNVTFVQNTSNCGWLDLARCSLGAALQPR